jgi:hypothetical protein
MGAGLSLGPISDGIGILEKLGVLESVKNKLLNNPDQAAAKMDLVFVELRKAYEALDDTIAIFCAMSFDDSDGRRDALEFLNKARGGKLEIAMLEARGHCDKIRYLYDRYLAGWFNRILDKSEQHELEQLFRWLGSGDVTWVDMLRQVAQEIQKFSDQVLTHAEASDFQAAEALRKSLAKDLRNDQDRLTAAFGHMYELKRFFAAIAR